MTGTRSAQGCTTYCLQCSDIEDVLGWSGIPLGSGLSLSGMVYKWVVGSRSEVIIIILLRTAPSLLAWARSGIGDAHDEQLFCWAIK